MNTALPASAGEMTPEQGGNPPTRGEETVGNQVGNRVGNPLAESQRMLRKTTILSPRGSFLPCFPCSRCVLPLLRAVSTPMNARKQVGNLATD